jgi:glucokinase
MTPAALRDDPRVVLVADIGGTTFRFNAVRAGRELLAAPHVLPSHGHDLARSLAQLVEGVAVADAATGRQAVALSLGFPGPADYEHGVIADLPNLRGYRGGVPVGPMLAARFGLPTFINNDGALFAYGEALGGLLPWVNGALAAGGSSRRFRNLLGFTLGTGFGAGVVVDGRLVAGDNLAAAEVWTMRHRDLRDRMTEEGVSIRAVRQTYAAVTGVALDRVPEPHAIAEIAAGRAPGDAHGAGEAFRRLGQVAGDTIAHALAVIDGLVVIGGGLSGAARWFRAALLDELNGTLETASGPVHRLPFRVLDLDDPEGLAALVGARPVELAVPDSAETVHYTSRKLTGLGVTRLGTSSAIALGAYACALEQLDARG